MKRIIKQNRPNYRKEIIGYTPAKTPYSKPIKIKGKKYIKVK